MKAVRWGAHSCVGLAALLTAVTLLRAGALPGAVAALAAGVWWGVGYWRGWRWAGDVAFAALVLLAGLGVFLDAPPLGSLVTVLLVLAGWDLGRWSAQVGESPRVEGELDLVRRHVQRLGGGLLLGGILSGLALNLQIDLQFGGALLLGLLMILASRWLLGALREG